MSKEQEHVESELKRLHAELQSLESQAERTGRIIGDRRRELIALTCPYRVGQRVKSRKGEMEISSIAPADYGKDAAYVLKGRTILSGGGLHKTERRIYDWDLSEAK